jgi:Cu+-exporting ATPase
MFLPFEWLRHPYVQLGLALPVYGLGMRHFGGSAWSSLKTGIPNMDVLVTLGSTAAFFYSLTGTVMALGPDYLFYETAATIITLILAGNVLEHRSVKRTSAAIDALANLQPDKSKRLTPEGEVERVPVDEVQVADTLVVNTGDTIPTDGEVLEGRGWVDESMLTGESEPLEKRNGAKVTGGTLLQDGNLTMMVTAVGQQTVLSKLIELVRRAQSHQPHIQRLGDKVSAYFVPAIVVIALGTFGVSWFVLEVGLQAALLRSIAVLVIACPCAMGLATPTAVMVGLGRAARQGILIKSGRSLEQWVQARHIVFDKTGTLTTGAFKLRGIALYNGAGEAEIRGVVKALEQRSSHPIARSLTQAIDERPEGEWQEVTESKGLGMQGVDAQGRRWQLGSGRVLSGAEQGEMPQHALYVTRDGELVAGIDLDDEERTDAQAAVAFFNQIGVQTHLLSGDSREKCQRTADRLGIKSVHAEQKPEEKLRFIEQCSADGGVAMVGDGINDGPSLSRADVGVSLGGGTDVAVQSADVVLMQDELSRLPEAFRMSRHTLMTIKQNLFWAFAYNIVAIPLAAAGYLNPMVAALSMAFSDVMVIGNSLRLRYKKLR